MIDKIKVIENMRRLDIEVMVLVEVWLKDGFGVEVWGLEFGGVDVGDGLFLLFGGVVMFVGGCEGGIGVVGGGGWNSVVGGGGVIMLGFGGGGGVFMGDVVRGGVFIGGVESGGIDVFLVGGVFERLK